MVWLPLFILLLGLPHARGGYSDGNYAEPECWVDTVLQPDCAILGDVLPRWDPAMPLEWTVDEPTSLQFWLDGEDPRHVHYGDGPVYHANVHDPFALGRHAAAHGHPRFLPHALLRRRRAVLEQGPLARAAAPDAHRRTQRAL